MKPFFLKPNWVIFLFLTVGSAWAQSPALTGVVTDALTKDPLVGVSVVIKGTSQGTTTDASGTYSIQVPGGSAVLVFSFIGYLPQEIRVGNQTQLDIRLVSTSESLDQVVVSASRVEESITKAAVTVEKLGARQLQQSPAVSPFDALQNLKGVDLLTQSLTFKSVNVRGFGANNNNRFVQLTDGMDNRSPGLGFGFGNVAGISDLDIESIELIPGASSALYGPDALQGLQLTRSKNPFEFAGLSAQIKVGVNNVGKAGFGPKPYTDFALRYAKKLGEKFAFKVNFQTLNGTDFIADDYSDRSTRARSNFFTTDPSRGGIATGIGYVPNDQPNTNLEYDGLNIYGDDINNSGAFRYPADFAVPALAGKLVTRTGYSELDVLGNNGKVTNTRANVALHYKLTDKIQASVGWYFGTGNFIRTAGFREYFPDYQRHQFKVEINSDNFFVRAYTTQQRAEGWNIGQTALAINNAWKPLATWANDFAVAYAGNDGNIGASRAAADQGRYLPGSDPFNAAKEAVIQTYNNEFIPGSTTVRGLRFRDNSAMYHYEGMYNFSKHIKLFDLLAGGSIRQYALNTGGTAVPRKPDGSEYGIREYGAYVQAAKEIRLADQVSFKPTAALRYDKNEYFQGGFTPRASAVFSVKTHHFRSSWQSAFRNPSAGQLLSIPAAGRGGEVGGSLVAAEGTGLLSNPAYLENDVKAYQAGTLSEAELRSRAYVPTNNFTTEKISTWEIGYKTNLQNKLFVDAFLYRSRYTDFIAAQNFLQPNNGQITDFNSNSFRPLQVNFNNFNEIFVNGWGIGVDYLLGRGFSFNANYTRQVGFITLRDAQGNVIKDNAGSDIVKRRMSNPEVSQKGRNFFISPENRYNLTFSNARVNEGPFGFAVTYRWTDKMWVEQGTTAGDIWLPSWSTIDAQVSYRLSALKSVVKVGGTNLLNQYYAQGYGLARIGGLYYVSLTFDELFR
jgi:outer membrane receptor protein involved in Fe transport